jgi:hypothetical protein
VQLSSCQAEKLVEDPLRTLHPNRPEVSRAPRVTGFIDC